MTITAQSSTERMLADLLETAREATRDASGHYHIRRPWECAETSCLGMHPAIRLARVCRRTEREARRLITHTHRWQPFLEGSICAECGQLAYEPREGGR